MTLYPFDGTVPTVAPTAFIAPGARIIGDVVIGDDVSIWYNCVLRGDVESIRVGARSNIQDGSIVHVTTGKWNMCLRRLGPSAPDPFAGSVHSQLYVALTENLLESGADGLSRRRP